MPVTPLTTLLVTVTPPGGMVAKPFNAILTWSAVAPSG